MTKLLFIPIYKSELDQLYSGSKSRGRGKGMMNSGLQCPYRYGLTTKQVKELISKGQWQQFLVEWEDLRYKYLEKHGLLCCICNRAENKYITILGKRICKRCQKKIDKLMIRNEK